MSDTILILGTSGPRQSISNVGGVGMLVNYVGTPPFRRDDLDLDLSRRQSKSPRIA